MLVVSGNIITNTSLRLWFDTQKWITTPKFPFCAVMNNFAKVIFTTSVFTIYYDITHWNVVYNIWVLLQLNHWIVFLEISNVMMIVFYNSILRNMYKNNHDVCNWI